MPNVFDPDAIPAWKEYATLHPLEWNGYDGACACDFCAAYRREFREWFEARKAEQSQAAGGVE